MSEENEVVALCNDHPTRYAQLGWRLLCTLLSWIVLGNSISEGNAFFGTIAIFSGTLLLDYFKYEPQGRLRKCVKKFGKVVNAIFLFIALVGLFGIISIVEINNQFFIISSNNFVFPNKQIIDIQYFWLSMLSSVLACSFDWIVNETSLEQSIARDS
mgnify:CR=1 FL=1